MELLSRPPLRAGAAAALLVAGCTYPQAPEPRFAQNRTIYAVVQVGAPIASLIAEETLETGGRAPLTGARAEIAGGTGTTPLLEGRSEPIGCTLTQRLPTVPGGEGCYSGRMPVAVEPDASYTLSLTTVDGARISGSVRTPRRPTSSLDNERVVMAYRVSPDPYPIGLTNLTVQVAPLADRVDAVATVRTFFTTVIDPRTGQRRVVTLDPSGCTVNQRTTPFRSASIPGTQPIWLYGVRCLVDQRVVAWDSLNVTVHVYAAERNYAAYQNHVLDGSSVAVDRASFGLEGAFGVFGALAVTELPLRLVFDSLHTH